MADKQVTIVVGPNKKITVNKQGLQEYLQEQLAKDPSLSSDSNKQALSEWKALGGKLSDIADFLTGNTEKTPSSGNFAGEYNTYKSQYDDLAQQTKKLQAEVVGTPAADQKTSEFKNKVSALEKAKADLATVATKRDDAKAKWDASKSASKPVETNQTAFDEAKNKADTAAAKLNSAKYSDKSPDEIKKLQDEANAAKAAQDAAQAKLKTSKDVYASQKESGFAPGSTTKAGASTNNIGAPTAVRTKAAPGRPQIPGGGPSGVAPTKPGDKPFAGVPVPGGSSSAVVSGTTPAAGGRGPSVPAKPTTPAKPILTKDDFLVKYGVQAALINSDPSLKALFDKASKGIWDLAKFKAEFLNTDWAKSHAETWQHSETARISAPTTYAQSYNNMRVAVANIASGLGVSISPDQIGAEIKPGEEDKVSDPAWRNQNDLVQWALDNSWGKGLDSAALSKHIAAVGQINLALPGGKAYDYMTQLKQYAADMGMGNLSLTGGKDFFTEAATNLILGTPNASLETYKSKILNDAKNNYKTLAPQFDAGLSFKSIAAPYTNTLANLLEVGADTIDLSSTTGYGKMITDALRGTDATNNTPMALYDFEKQVKSNPSWAYTNNARDSIMGGTHDLLKMFGKVS